MENNQAIQMESNEIPEEIIDKISEILKEIKNHQDSNEVHPQKLFDLYYYINDTRIKEYEPNSKISDLFTNNYMYLFRTLLLQEKGIRIIILKILRNNIQIYPPFTQKMLENIMKEIYSNQVAVTTGQIYKFLL